MKNIWLDTGESYEGGGLRSLRAYLEFGLLGDSVYAWKGPCKVSFAHMVDGEDWRAKSKIEGAMMVHFIAELFDVPLIAGVALQRIFADHARTVIQESSQGKFLLQREGDDLYWAGAGGESKKLSISIATRSPVSVLVHFAVNVVNDGTPVATCCLQDFGLEPKVFAEEVLRRVSTEWTQMKEATWKVRPVS